MKPVLAAALLWWSAPAGAVTCENITWESTSYTACSVMPDEDLRLFEYGVDGEPLGSFAAIEAEAGRPLWFAMNAGMFHPDRSPVGWYVEEGEQIAPLVTRAGPGNFGMLPNGIFCITDAGDADVRTTDDHLNDAAVCRFATQSGPMLVMGDDLHPRFIRGSRSKYIRNGVGADYFSDTTWFVISNEPVNFYDFARFFRDRLDVHNALYFDGKVSRLYAPMIGRNDAGFPMGPMVGVLGQ